MFLAGSWARREAAGIFFPHPAHGEGQRPRGYQVRGVMDYRLFRRGLFFLISLFSRALAALVLRVCVTLKEWYFSPLCSDTLLLRSLAEPM